MLNSTNNVQPILNLMKQGAQVVYHHYWHGYDGCSEWTKTTLRYKGHDMEIAPRIVHALRMSGQLKQEYPVFHGEHARNWETIAEHKDAPVPAWVAGQWGFDD